MRWTDKIEVTNEDCMELLKRYPENYFDLAIVDPPYGIGIDGQKKSINKNPKHNRKYHKKKHWDIKPKGKYFNLLFDKSVNQVIWGANYFVDVLRPSKSWVVWYKGQEGLTMSDCELCFTSFDFPTRVCKINRVELLKQKSIHPTEKPIKLYEWLLMNYATCKTCRNEGGYYEDVAGDGGSQMWQHCDDCVCADRRVRILDTHLGSGSIAIACHNLGFELTACEADREYYDAAYKRFKEVTAQARLW